MQRVVINLIYWYTTTPNTTTTSTSTNNIKCWSILSHNETHVVYDITIAAGTAFWVGFCLNKYSSY